MEQKGSLASILSKGSIFVNLIDIVHKVLQRSIISIVPNYRIFWSIWVSFLLSGRLEKQDLIKWKAYCKEVIYKDSICMLSLMDIIIKAKCRRDSLFEPRISPNKSWMSYLYDTKCLLDYFDFIIYPLFLIFPSLSINILWWLLKIEGLSRYFFKTKQGK